jgi:phytoene synthase
LPTRNAPGKLTATDTESNAARRVFNHGDQVRQSETRARSRELAGDEIAYCRRVTREHAKSFYFCAQFLPAPKRDAIYAVYALCRSIDDVVDRGAHRPTAETRAMLDEWRRGLREERGDDVALRAWRAVSARYAIDPRHAEALVDGVLMDLEKTSYADYGELELYCYRVASVVGLMTSKIFGYSSPDALARAATLGHAMQLTNICRDVGEDARMGRVYLPDDEMRRFGVTRAAILESRLDDRFVALMRFQIERARRLYAEAEPGIELLDADCRYTVRLSSRIYEGILDAIERNGYDVLSRRAFVPFARKVAAIPSVYVTTLLAKRAAAGATRMW